MDYIVGTCRTNLDDYVCPVTQFVAVPKIGAKVYVEYKGVATLLYVIGITHYEIMETPAIGVELGKKETYE